MTDFTVVTAGDMVWPLADGDGTVVTTDTGSQDVGMIHPGGR